MADIGEKRKIHRIPKPTTAPVPPVRVPEPAKQPVPA